MILAVLVCLSGGLAPDWKLHRQPPELEFPRDHGAHREYRTEWWYLTAELSDEEGRRYGVQLTIFRQGMESGLVEPQVNPPAPRWQLREAFAGHLALADIGSGRFRHAERVRRPQGGLAGASDKALDVWLEDWSFVLEPDGRLRARARDAESGVECDLAFALLKPLVLHGDRGLSRKGPEDGNASAYFSWTRLSGEGALTIDGRARKVRGEAWFDHEWGSSQLGGGVVGWDWLGLRLSDRRELMVYCLRRADGSVIEQSGGTLILADGSTRALRRDEILLEARQWWQSPRSGGKYPCAWSLRVPSAGIDGRLSTQLADCELDTAGSSGVIYWEGPVTLEGSVSGSGYAELTGYAGSLGGRF